MDKGQELGNEKDAAPKDGYVWDICVLRVSCVKEVREEWIVFEGKGYQLEGCRSGWIC